MPFAQQEEAIAIACLVVPVVFVGFLFLFSLFETSVPTLVLLDYRISSSSQKDPLVVIAGRPDGIWAWFLALIGLGTSIRFEVTKMAVQREISSPSRHIIDSAPINNISSTNYGSSKRLLFLVLAVILMLASAAGLAVTLIVAIKERELGIGVSVATFIVGFLFLIGFLLSKRIVIQVETSGGRFIGIKFKPSVLGKLTVDSDEIAKVVRIINSFIASDTIPVVTRI